MATFLPSTQLRQWRGGTSTVNGLQLGRDSLLLGAGLAIQCAAEQPPDGFYYDGELGRKDYEMASVTGGIRFTF